MLNIKKNWLNNLSILLGFILISTSATGDNIGYDKISIQVSGINYQPGISLTVDKPLRILSGYPFANTKIDRLPLLDKKIIETLSIDDFNSQVTHDSNNQYQVNDLKLFTKLVESTVMKISESIYFENESSSVFENGIYFSFILQTDNMKSALINDNSHRNNVNLYSLPLPTSVFLMAPVILGMMLFTRRNSYL